MRRTCGLVLLVLLALTLRGRAVTFDVTPNTKRCFVEEIVEGELILGEYSLSGLDARAAADVSVLTPAQEPIFHQPVAAGESGSFALTAPTSGDYSLCIHAPSSASGTSRFTFRLREGVDAIDYAVLARREHLAPLDVALVRMEDILGEIAGEMRYMKTREARLRDLSEDSNRRAAWISVAGLVFAVVVFGVQAYSLRRFFIAKKLV